MSRCRVTIDLETLLGYRALRGRQAGPVRGRRRRPRRLIREDVGADEFAELEDVVAQCPTQSVSVELVGLTFRPDRIGRASKQPRPVPAPSLRRIRLTCCLTVPSEMNSLAAMAALVRALRHVSRIWASRAVKVPRTPRTAARVARPRPRYHPNGRCPDQA